MKLSKRQADPAEFRRTLLIDAEGQTVRFGETIAVNGPPGSVQNEHIALVAGGPANLDDVPRSHTT